MTWLQQIGAAVLLVVLTLCLQCAGVAAIDQLAKDGSVR